MGKTLRTDGPKTNTSNRSHHGAVGNSVRKPIQQWRDALPQLQEGVRVLVRL